VDRNEIKSLIEARWETQTKLAEEIGVSPAAVGEALSGRSKGAAIRYAIAKALGVEVEDIWPTAKDSAA
jgi:DNA-binding XRE family transcriptional regulator